MSPCGAQNERRTRLLRPDDAAFAASGAHRGMQFKKALS